MDDKKETKQITDFTASKENKEIKQIKEEKVKANAEQELIVAYAQLVFHTLKHSATEITPKTIKEEVKMFYEKFGNKEVKRLANMIIKEKKKKK